MHTQTASETTQTIITRAEAIAAGAKTYFTGEPCNQGHLTERHVDAFDCVECRKVALAEWKAQAFERKRAAGSARYAADKESMSAASAARYSANKARKRENAERNREARAALKAELKRASDADWWSAKAERELIGISAYRSAGAEERRKYHEAWQAMNYGSDRPVIARVHNTAPSDAEKPTAHTLFPALTAETDEDLERRERVKAAEAAWRASSAERYSATLAARYATSPGKLSAYRATRRARERNARPAKWSSSDRAKFQKMKAACKRLEAMTGFAWHIDHRVPLSKGGQHCVSNLQLIPARLNLRKLGKLLYVEPWAWVEDALKNPFLQLPWITN